MTRTLEKKLDELFSQLIRLRDADCNGYIRCYCCVYPVHWKLAQAMHFMNRRHLGTRYDEKNVHAGCASCNTYNNGNLEAYESHLINEYGENIIDRLTMLKNAVTKISDEEARWMLIEFQEEINKLKKEKGL